MAALSEQDAWRWHFVAVSKIVLVTPGTVAGAGLADLGQHCGNVVLVDD
jgi:hypothetical protein